MLRRALVAALATVPLAAVPLAAAMPPAFALPTSAGSLAAYSVVTDRATSASGLIARAVIPAGTACPAMSVTVDGRDRSVRSIPRRLSTTTWPAFASVKVCEARMPVGATNAEFAGRSIPAHMPTTVRNMALFGDTGCRLSKSQIQDCADPTQWPLATIAARIAAEKPDLIVHVGDYFYREVACPAADVRMCGGDPVPLNGYPFDDSQYGWVADMLLPMTPMFSVAPIVFTRGNHESCTRGGNGYFLFIDPGWQDASECAPRADGTVPTATQRPYPIDLPLSTGRTLRLVIVDSANGSDQPPFTPLPGKRAYYELAQRLASKADESWLVTHRPLFARQSQSLVTGPSDTASPWISFDEAVESHGLLGRYALILGSHVHLTQAVQIPGQPGQLVLGNGATLLDPPTGYGIPPYGPLASDSGAPLAPGITPYPTASRLWTDVRFGYAMATPGRAVGAWSMDMKGPDGTAFAACAVAKREIACR